MEMGARITRVWAALLLLCLVAGHTHAIEEWYFDCAEIPRMPDSLDSVSFLGATQEFHFQGEFLMNTTEPIHEVSFHLERETEFRFYVAPHEIDVDLALSVLPEGATEKQHMGASVNAAGFEESISGTLKGGHYFLEIITAGSLEVGHTCPTVTLEVAMVPLDRITSRVNQFTCPDKELLPSINTSPLSRGERVAFSTQGLSNEFNVKTPGPDDADYRYIRSYPIPLPKVVGRSGYWKVEVTMEHEFLTGGGLGMLLTRVAPDDDSEPVLAQCFLDEECTVGSRWRQNEVHIRIGATPGYYQLWLYSQREVDEESELRVPCIPFHLSLLIEPEEEAEDLINCPAVRLPNSFNQPGYLDDAGHMHYRQMVLMDLQHRSYKIPFTLQHDTLFRAFTSEHAVDIDMELMSLNGNVQNTLAASFGKMGEETIVYELKHGDYALEITFYDSMTEQLHFCETFLLEVAMSPTVPNLDRDCWQHDAASSGNATAPSSESLDPRVVLPSFEKVMNEALASDSHEYHTSDMTIFTSPLTSHVDQEVYRATFKVHVATQIEVRVGSSFLISDVRVLVRSVQKHSWRLRGEHRGNLNVLRGLVEPIGEYELIIFTSSRQRPPPALPSFPSCHHYSLAVDFVPAERLGDQACAEYPRVPPNLNMPQFMPFYPSNRVHFADTFRVSLEPGDHRVTESMHVRVDSLSVLRAATVQGEGDVIDIKLYEGERAMPVYQSKPDMYHMEEAVFFQLKAGIIYRIDVEYHNLQQGAVEGSCLTFRMEVEIAPADEVAHVWPTNAEDVACEVELMPADDLLEDQVALDTGIIDISEFYSFAQTDKPMVHSLPFSVYTLSVMRATVSYNFLTSDLSLRLESRDSPTVYGDDLFNMNEISAQLLAPGDYVLDVYESEVMPPGKRRCVQFEFTFVLDEETAEFDPVDPLGCPDSPLPWTFNSVGYVSALTGNTMDWQGPVLANVRAGVDYTEFSLQARSVFRAHISWHQELEIDVYVRRGTRHSPGEVVAKSVSTADETLLVLLQPGDYVLELRFSPNGMHTFPEAEDCTSFMAQFALYPEAALHMQMAALGEACTDSTPAPALAEGRALMVPYQRALERAAPFAYNSTFAVHKHSVFSAQLGFHFVTGNLAMVLAGNMDVNGNVVHHEVDAPMAMNRVFFEEVLPPGEYTLQVHDPDHAASREALGFLKCVPYAFGYHLHEMTVEEEQEERRDGVCELFETLPKDLYSDDGGSSGMGGPQQDDGSIWLYAAKLLMPQPGEVRNREYVDFMVTKPSYVRAWVHAEEEGNDIDLFVFDNRNRTAEEAHTLSKDAMIKHASSHGWTESSLMHLEPSGTPYTLVVYYFDTTASDSDPCQYYRMEVVVVPEDDVHDQLLCAPDEKAALPPTEFDARTKADRYYSGEMVLTEGAIEAGTNAQNVFVHRIAVHLPAGTWELNSYVLFDFVANDFRMYLRDGEGDLLHEALPTGEVDSGSPYNFMLLLSYEMEGGVTVFIDIEEDLSSKELQLDAYCHRGHFEFTLHELYVEEEFVAEGEQHTGEGDTAPEHSADFDPIAWMETHPRILFINPWGGQNMDPDSHLVVDIVGSQAFRDEDGDMGAYIKDNRVVTLREVDGETGEPTGEPILPYDGVLMEEDDFAKLRIVFHEENLRFDASYTLVVEWKKLHGVHGGEFEPEEGADQLHIFHMKSKCKCNGRGQCNSEGTCECYEMYTGPECRDCALNYHRAAEMCVANTPCDVDSCNGHGTCVDAAGYPVCTCEKGYTDYGDARCAVCDDGYMAMPGEADGTTECVYVGNQELQLCDAPVLPSTLDMPGFLVPDGRVHLNNDFYADMDHHMHAIDFTLTQPSLFRVRVLHDDVDIDLQLFTVNTKGDKHEALVSEDTRKKEETLFLELDGSMDAPRTHRLMMYMYGENRPCTSVNLELAIEPKAPFLASIADVRADCKSNDVLPDFPLDRFADVPDENFSYAPADVFTLNAAPAPVDHAPRFFWHRSIAIREVDGRQPFLYVRTGFNFLIGDVGVLVEAGRGETHCGDDMQQGECWLGVNGAHENMFNRAVPPGNYSVWLYEPAPQRSDLTTCIEFEFEMAIVYERVPDTLFTCEAPRLPTLLSDPRYMDTRGYMHVSEDFYLDYTKREHTMFFTVTSDTLFRAFVPGHTVDVDLQLTDLAGHSLALSQEMDEADTVFALVSAGSYQLVLGIEAPIEYHEVAARCNTIYMELALAPLYELVALDCTADFAPTIPHMEAPLHYGHVDAHAPDVMAFLTYSNSTFKKDRVVASYPLLVSDEDGENDVVDVVVEVRSDFVTADLMVRVSDARGNHMMHGAHKKNANRLHVRLGAGRYTVDVVQPRPSLGGFDCLAYELEVHVARAVDVPVHEKECSGVGEPLPYTLDSLRFLGLDGRVHVQDDWAVPHFGGDMRFTQHEIHFSTDRRSLFRVYVEDHDVDIDLTLHRVSGDGVSDEVASSHEMFVEESILSVLAPDAQYKLTITFVDYNEQLAPCQTFAMELAMYPQDEVPAWERVCLHGGSNWGNSLERENAVQHYDSTERGHHLYFQQQEGSPQGMLYTLHVKAPSRLRIEVGYQFLTGDLAIKMRPDTSSEWPFVGTNYENRNVLVLNDVEPGVYIIKIYEPVTEMAEDMSCSHFTLSYDFAPQDATERLPWISPADHIVPQVPHSFDGASMLRYGHSFHVSKAYHTLLTGTRSIQEVPFTVDRPSVFRAWVQPHNLDFDLKLHNVSRGGEMVTASQHLSYIDDELLAVVPAAAYALNIRAQSEDQEHALAPRQHRATFRMEAAVEPLDAVQRYLELLPSISTCVDSHPPHVELNRRGFYHFFSKAMMVSAQTLDSREDIMTVQVHVPRVSAVFARITYHFVYNDLSLKLVKPDSDVLDGRPRTWHGQKYRNMHDVYEIVQPGTYNVTVYQPLRQPIAADKHHCGVYSFEIRIEDATSSREHDCDEASIIPFNLDDEGAGSEPYGGPMKDGHVRIRGRFLFPAASQGDTEGMQFTPSEDSLVRVIFHTQSPRNEVDMRLYETSEKTIDAVATYTSSYVRSQLFRVAPAAQGGPHTLLLWYSKVDKAMPCPMFDVDFAVQPVAKVKAAVQCGALSMPEYNLPNPEVQVSELGFGSSYMSSFIPTTAFNSFSNHFGFKYPITFEVKRPSTLEVELEFNYMTNFFVLELEEDTGEVSETPGDEKKPTFGLYAMGTGESEQTLSGRTQYKQKLGGRLQPGKYRLNIVQDAGMRNEALWGTADEFCFPYVFSLTVTPVDAPPLILEVTPSSGSNLTPGEDLVVEVLFSVPLFTSAGARVAEDHMHDAVYLAGSDHSAVAAETMSPDAKGTKWMATFPGAAMQSGVTYKLQLRPSLFDAKGKVFTSTAAHVYTMRGSRCHGHGTIGDDDVCTCEHGYAGDHCDECADGFEDTWEGSSSVLECTRIISTECTRSTCGCRNYPTDDEHCEALGECMVVGGRAECRCLPGLAGPSCERCADGFSGYPECAEETEFHCVHGTFIAATRTCHCYGTFDGPQCDQCKPGYSGKYCDVEATLLEWVMGLLAPLLGIGVTLLVVVAVVLKVRAHRRKYGYASLSTHDDQGAFGASVFDSDSDADDVEGGQSVEMRATGRSALRGAGGSAGGEGSSATSVATAAATAPREATEATGLLISLDSDDGGDVRENLFV